MHSKSSAQSDNSMSLSDAAEAPRHGFHGDRTKPASPHFSPAAVTIAVSREAGSRGGSIARRAGRKLGWQVYDQELLEYMAHEGALRQAIFDGLTAQANDWIETRLVRLQADSSLSEHPSVVDLARIVLALGSQGEVVILGRGAGTLLPQESTLHVRIMAPLEDRIAYMSQWLRLTRDEAAAQVNDRDSRRAEFVSTHFHRQPAEVYQYDLLLNSSLLGEELCADIIVRAAQAKLALRKSRD